ncbi:hypothetical protein AB1Y20_003258 [Prymnesium parvum]|uniref:Protein FAN n=1 Tax=Prymnesium parvum TaxID=97485 RepID=A0AB34JBB8_PRYPA
MFRRKTRRFHLLLLDHGETFIEDHAATFHPSEAVAALLGLRLGRASWKGRIHCGSKSLTFEPEELDAPLVRLLLSELTQPLLEWHARPHAPASEPLGESGFLAHAAAVLHKRETHQPFVSLKLPEGEPLRFVLLHTRAAAFVAQMLPVQRSLSDGKAQALLQAQWRAQQDNKSFDLTGLVDPLETHLLEARVQRVRPMVSTAAILLLSESRIYLQDCFSSDAAPLTHWAIGALQHISRRRHLLRHTALELHFTQAGAGSGRTEQPVSSRLALGAPESLLLNFRSNAERERACEAIGGARAALALPPLPPPLGSKLGGATDRWRNGQMDNFDYLMFLNDCAGRSLNDLTQYPVFPWVLSDYSSSALDLNDPAVYRDLSKPIGALNPVRLEVFRERYYAMEPGERFYYGTHYSAPAFVAYFLLRQAPELTLHLHGGKFDEPDRQFTSVRAAWESALKSTSDVKELIPQFYVPELHSPASSSFLTNASGLQLGTRQAGTVVGDVELPPWATSPFDFATKCRAALESPYVSAHLHLWIDLIFGCKQQGEAAERADNVFCPHTYEGRVDIDAEMEEHARRAIEQQVAEFGQTPSQLFTEPHPQRIPLSAAAPDSLFPRPAAHAPPPDARAITRSSSNEAPPAAPPPPPRVDHAAELAAAGAALSHLAVAPSQSRADRDGAAAAVNRQSSANGWAGASRGEGAYGVGEPIKAAAVATAPSWGDSASADSTDTKGRVELVLRLQRAADVRLQDEPVSSVWVAEDGTTVCSVGGPTVRVYCTKREQLLRCAPIRGRDLLALGSWDNAVWLYSVGRGRVVDSTQGHHEASVSCLSESKGKLLSGSWDSSVRVWALSGNALEYSGQLTEHEDKVSCVHLDGWLAASGSAAGDIQLGDLRANSGATRSCRVHGDLTSGVALTADGRYLVSCSLDGSIAATDLRGGRTRMLRDSGPPLRCVNAVNGAAVLCGGDAATVTLWDASSMQTLHELKVGPAGPSDAIHSMHYWSPGVGNSAQLVTGLADGTYVRFSV